MTRVSGLRLPYLPGSVCSLLYKLVGDDPSPHIYSGATIQVQRSQRTDELERMMNEMQQRRYIRIGRPMQGQLPQPSEDQASNCLKIVTKIVFSSEITHGVHSESILFACSHHYKSTQLGQCHKLSVLQSFVSTTLWLGTTG